MTPQEALAQTLDSTFFPPSGPYISGYPPSHERIAYQMAETIIAALPEGWELVDLPNFGKFILAERAYGAKHERERLLRLCSLDRDCPCPISHDLRLRE